jgi:hypothetical protein
MLDFCDDSKDLWLIFELCGKPLSKAMYEVKGEFYRGERIYSVGHDPNIYAILEQNGCDGVKKIMKSMA